MMVQTSAPKFCQKQNTSLIYLRYYTLPTCYTYTINMSFCYDFNKKEYLMLIYDVMKC